MKYIAPHLVPVFACFIIVSCDFKKDKHDLSIIFSGIVTNALALPVSRRMLECMSKNFLCCRNGIFHFLL